MLDLLMLDLVILPNSSWPILVPSTKNERHAVGGVRPNPDPVNTCVNTFRRKKSKKKPPGLCNLSGVNELTGRR